MWKSFYSLEFCIMFNVLPAVLRVHHMMHACGLHENTAADLKLFASQSLSHMMAGL